jgi:hypothetical protein
MSAETGVRASLAAGRPFTTWQRYASQLKTTRTPLDVG